MGRERTVLDSTSLDHALTRLKAEGLDCQILMVDGQLVHPSAKPPDRWSEVRLRTPAGMVTLRRRAEQVSILVFGNAVPDLVDVSDRIAAAFESLP